jgi:hypothetical protein
MPTNDEYIAEARLKKCRTMADFLERQQISADRAEFLEPPQWLQLSSVARVNKLSPTSQALTIRILRAREEKKIVNIDPNDGAF